MNQDQPRSTKINQDHSGQPRSTKIIKDNQDQSTLGLRSMPCIAGIHCIIC